ncbi:tripartite tricarboxylate transporter TctB family protein [Nocardioides sp.]|uniref:tripartite tricarboxylate transporter TctB family protein n=1 Tax=Nocardioides sp. TaxID=35761 RepID=UPI0027355726|nr:tripartite tricarboxylate transporter TctB family protein [Nocardioides sp.]MDP3890998.1 tripartite tricarboxylate transporter TctB family protein [Nocardioides sp.]
MTSFRFSHRTLGVVVGLFAAGYLALVSGLPDFVSVSVPVQPATLPRWLGMALLVLAVVLFLLPEDAEAEPEAAAPPGSVEAEPLGRMGSPAAEIGLFAVSIAVYVALFEPLGFVLATTAYLAATTWYLGYPRHLVNGVVSIAVPLALYLTMTAGLDVVLPTGPLPF